MNMELQSRVSISEEEFKSITLKIERWEEGNIDSPYRFYRFLRACVGRIQNMNGKGRFFTNNPGRAEQHGCI